MGIMKGKEMALGQALALVAAEFDGLIPDSTPYIPDFDKQLVQRLRDKWLFIESSNAHQCILRNSFRPSCRQDCRENACLENNHEFFISFLIHNLHSESVSSDFPVARCLNNCFRCFEIFKEVARDFCFSYFEIRGRCGEVASKPLQPLEN
jgi:hypothetical protein